MASPTQWTWVSVNSGSWWWTGRAGVLQSMGLQRVGHDWVTELNWTDFLLDEGQKKENHLLMYFWLFCLFSLFVKSNWLRKYFLSTTIENSFLQANPVNFVFSVYFWSMSEFGQNVTIRILYMSLSQKNLHSFVCVWNIFPLLYILLNVVIITKKQAIF